MIINPLGSYLWTLQSQAIARTQEGSKCIGFFFYCLSLEYKNSHATVQKENFIILLWCVTEINRLRIINKSDLLHLEDGELSLVDEESSSREGSI